MKTILVITNLLFLGFILYQNFLEKEPMYKPPVKNCDHICTDYSSDLFKGISANLAQRISENYVRDKGKKFIGNGVESTGTEDARSAWFSLETLKKFIWNIEHAVCGQNCSGKLNLGIRIYYAKYPDSAIMVTDPELKDLVNPLFAKHHTLFMVPTYEIRGGENIDFDPWHWEGAPGNCQPTSLRDQIAAGALGIDTLREKSLILTLGSGTTIAWRADLSSAQQNHGDLAPPPSGTGAFGR